MRNEGRYGVRWALALWLVAAMVPARAVDVGNLYEVSVPAAGVVDDDVFRQGMAAVLVRVTGRRDAATLPQLAGLIDGASRYVSSYRRAGTGSLLLSFDAESIERAIAAAGLPFWAEERPTTLVWLAVDRGGGQRGLVVSGSSPEREAMEQVAAERGVPLVWPSLLSGAEARRRFDQAWAGDTASLGAEAPSYGASGVLAGRAVPAPAGGYTVEWSFAGPDGVERTRGDFGAGVHLAADRYAARYASAAAGRRDEVDITVAGITNAVRYAEAMRYLQSLAVVRDVNPREVRPDSVVFRVAVRGGLDSLRRAATSGGRMFPVDNGTGEAAFRLQP